MRFLSFALTAILATVSCVVAAPAGAQISSLPGWSGALPFNAYGGYFPANDGQKQLYYFFAEALNNPSTAPVLLWLNGGPGCSSWDGMIYENGPFNFAGPQGAQQKLTLNPYAWNTVANTIYLDSPAGVGLSYSTDPNNDYQTNDDITAKDSHSFLLNFFAAYPEFAKNDFYIAGESYAGIYVPTLANQVMLGNQQNQTINLKGILVGNGVTDAQYDGNAFIPFVTGHGWVDIDTQNALNTYCQGNFYNNSNQQCQDAQNAASNDVAGLNVYNPYGDCSGSSVAKIQTMSGPITDLFTRVAQRTRDYAAGLGGSVPCVDSSAATNWLNLDSVRTAIHAIPVSQQAWTICADQIQYSRNTDSTLAIHRALLAASIRVLVYSGDTDMCVPFTGSEAWTRSLGYPITDAWRAWNVNSQVAGYVQGYQGGLTFLTVKGAGHMVPQYRPPQALQMLTSFLNNQPF